MYLRKEAANAKVEGSLGHSKRCLHLKKVNFFLVMKNKLFKISHEMF